jgi:hypothetical protein
MVQEQEAEHLALPNNLPFNELADDLAAKEPRRRAMGGPDSLLEGRDREIAQVRSLLVIRCPRQRLPRSQGFERSVARRRAPEWLP